jgi:hypothetical protein
MPLPINPPPSTPTLSIFFIRRSLVARVRSNLSLWRARSGRNCAEQSSRALELAVFEAIENLLQSELYSGEDSAMGARDPVSGQTSASERQDGYASSDEQGQMGDDESEANDSTH